MKRTVGAICTLVALCTSALGFYAWQWIPEQYFDSAWDANNQSDLSLTGNNGSHAVALGFDGNDYWTSVAAGAEHQASGQVCYDSVCAYEWVGLGRQYINSNEWPYPIWQHDQSNVCHPSYGSVAANNSYKLWMEPGTAGEQFAAAAVFSAPLVRVWSAVGGTT